VPENSFGCFARFLGVFDRGCSLSLAASATGGARERSHFDTLPYMLTRRSEINASYSIVCCITGGPLCPIAVPENSFGCFARFLGVFDRGCSLSLAVSATGGAREQSHFDTLPCMLTRRSEINASYSIVCCRSEMNARFATQVIIRGFGRFVKRKMRKGCGFAKKRGRGGAFGDQSSYCVRCPSVRRSG